MGILFLEKYKSRQLHHNSQYKSRQLCHNSQLQEKLGNKIDVMSLQVELFVDT